MFLGNVPLNIDWQQILLHALNFVILVGGLYFILFKPVKKFMAKRDEEHQKQENEINKRLEEAKTKEELITKRLFELDEEIKNKHIEASKDVELYRQDALRKAKEEAENIVTKAKNDAIKDKERIISEANEEIKDLVLAATEKLLLKETVDEAYNQFLDSADEDGDSSDK